MSREIEGWIETSLVAQGLLDRIMDPGESDRVLSMTRSRFVSGSPRVWWLGFPRIISSCPSESSKLGALVSDPNAIGWFIPETEGEGELVYRLSADEAAILVSDCPFFEYYFLDATGELLIAETDHNEFLVASPVIAS